LGKTQIRQLTAFDFISALILGELVGNALYDPDVGIPQIAFAVILWGGLLYMTEIITLKYKGTRSFLEGNPAIVISKGLLQREEMKKNKLDMNQFLHLLRMKDVFSVQEVDYAILESDGTVSVLKKTQAQPLNRLDLNLPVEEVYLPITLINDGEIIYDNLEQINQDEQWLVQELRKQDIYTYKDIFYAEYKKGETLFIQKM
jgi:uncharacterized membrane protein YcaP (DUF421 family)